jgi:hypothetical protein
MEGAGHAARDPLDLAVGGRDDLQVHAVAVLAGVERPVSGNSSMGIKVPSITA